MYTFEFITRANWGAWKRPFVFSLVALRKLGRRGEVLKNWAMVRKLSVGAWVHGESRGMVEILWAGLGMVWRRFGESSGMLRGGLYMLLRCIIITHDEWIIIAPWPRCAFAVNLPNIQEEVEIWLISSWETVPRAVPIFKFLIQPRGRPCKTCVLGC